MKLFSVKNFAVAAATLGGLALVGLAAEQGQKNAGVIVTYDEGQRGPAGQGDYTYGSKRIAAMTQFIK